MKKKLKNTKKPNTPIILFGYITDPPGGGGGGGGGGYNPGYPTYPGTGGGGGESTGDGSGGTLPHGTLSADDQYQVGTTFFAPSITSFVRFRCLPGAAPTPHFTCQTRALGGWKTVANDGAPFIITTIDVPIDASNITVNVTFQTSDTNGGACTWQAMHN